MQRSVRPTAWPISRPPARRAAGPLVAIEHISARDLVMLAAHQAPARPGPARPRYGRCGLRSSGASARRRLRRSTARRLSWTRREAAAVCPSTARNALVIATAILVASNVETVPLRRMICIGGSLRSGERLGTQLDEWVRFWFRGSSGRFDIVRPRDVVGAGCHEGRCMECTGGKRRQASASDRRDTPPVDVFSVSRQVSWLAGRRRSLSSQCECRISDVKIGSNSLLTVAGQRRNFANRAIHRLPS